MQKCEFNKEEIIFVIHGLQERHEDGSIQISAIMDEPVPQSVKDVKYFPGLANFYRKFIQSYSNFTPPLTTLTNQVRPVCRGECDLQVAPTCLHDCFHLPDFLASVSSDYRGGLILGGLLEDTSHGEVGDIRLYGKGEVSLEML